MSILIYVFVYYSMMGQVFLDIQRNRSSTIGIRNFNIYYRTNPTANKNYTNFYNSYKFVRGSSIMKQRYSNRG